MLEIVDLNFKRDAFANTLSRGQTQRLGLARVLLHDPQVLLLDEPLSGLDPRARIEMRNLLRRLGQTGKTIIVSSHILPELADVCNKIGIIDRGVMSFSDEVSEVIKKVRNQIILQVGVKNDDERAMQFLDADSQVASVVKGDGFLVVTLKDEVTDYSEIPTALIGEGFKLTLFQEEEVNLESAFMALTKGTGQNF
jgi:ABC-2 type transport system ATP-binding protein